MKLDRNEGATSTKCLVCHEKKGTLYPVLALVQCGGPVTGELGWRQEDRVSAFSKFEARDAESSGVRVVIERGQERGLEGSGGGEVNWT